MTTPLEYYPIFMNKPTELTNWLDRLPQAPNTNAASPPRPVHNPEGQTGSSQSHHLLELPCGCKSAREVLEAHLRSRDSCPACEFELFKEVTYETFVLQLGFKRSGRLSKDERDCCLCQTAYFTPAEGLEWPVRLSCGHLFGHRCIRKWTDPEPEGSDQNTCPLCRAHLFGPVHAEDGSQNDNDADAEGEPDDAFEEASESAETDDVDRMSQNAYGEWVRVGRLNGWVLPEERPRHEMPRLEHEDQVEAEVTEAVGASSFNQETESVPSTLDMTENGTEAPAYPEAGVDTDPGVASEPEHEDLSRANTTYIEEPEVAQEQEVSQEPPTEPGTIGGRLRRRRQEERANAAVEQVQEGQSHFNSSSGGRKRRHDEGRDSGLEEMSRSRTRRRRV